MIDKTNFVRVESLDGQTIRAFFVSDEELRRFEAKAGKRSVTAYLRDILRITDR